MTLLMSIILQALGAALIAIFLVWSTYRGKSDVKPNNDWLKTLSVLPDKINLGIRSFIIFGAMFLLGDLMWAAGPFVHRFYLYAVHAMGIETLQVVVGALVIIYGLGAYSFKTKHQALYGLVEILFAGALGVAIAKQLTPTTQLFGPVTALVGAVYVVSRGAGNIADGWKKTEKAENEEKA